MQKLVRRFLNFDDLEADDLEASVYIQKNHLGISSLVTLKKILIVVNLTNNFCAEPCRTFLFKKLTDSSVRPN